MAAREFSFFFAMTALPVGASIWLLHGWAFAGAAMLAAGILIISGLRFIRRRRLDGRSTRTIVLALSASVILLASVAFFQWPLKTAHFLSRPELERVVAELKAGRKFNGPTRVGAFWIERAEFRYCWVAGNHCHPEQFVCLWTVGDPTGDAALIRCAPNERPFREAWSTPLDARWQIASQIKPRPAAGGAWR